MNKSPYEGLSVQDWQAKTLELIDEHPLSPNEIYQLITQVWSEIFLSSITSRGYKIGADFFPSPQVIGSLLHDLIPLEFAYIAILILVRYRQFFSLLLYQIDGVRLCTS